MENDQQQSKPLVLVTGGSGLLGQRIISRLADRYQCIGLDKAGNPKSDKRVENIHMDITDEESIKAALERVRYAYGSSIASVVHLAAFYDFSGEPSPLYDTVTVQGTAKLLDALKSMEKVEQFIFSSTNLVYEPTEPGKKISEDAPLDPNWDYPESKVKTEKVIKEKDVAAHTLIFRLAGAYDEEGHSPPLTHQLQRIYEKRITSHFYSGELIKGNAFIHLDDAVDAFVKAVEKRNELPDEAIVNLSEEETISYDELQDIIGENMYGQDWPTFRIAKPLAKAGAWVRDQVGDPFIKPWMVERADDHYELDISRARKLLDWQPTHHLRESLPRIVKNLKDHPKQFYKTNKLHMNKQVEGSEK